MDPKPNGWSMPTGSRGGRSPRGPTKFPKADKMPTARQMTHQRRQESILAQKESYLFDPPPDERLFEARLVIAGKHPAPDGLGRPLLDEIRVNYSVWIVQVEPHLLDVSSRTMPDLRQAMNELNRVINEMRAKNEAPQGSSERNE